MKKTILIIIFVVLIIGISVPLNYLIGNLGIQNILIEAMNSRTYIYTEENEKTFFKDYKIGNVENAVADKYTFVDLDEDKTKELVILTDSNYGAYIVLRYDKKKNKVFSYCLGIREFQDIKMDGTFSSSGGAGYNSYNRIEFNNNKKKIINLAINYVDSGEHKINDKDVTKEEIEEFVNEWNKKESCIWKTYGIAKSTSSNSSDEVNSVIGIYHNDNWNGREATLVLNKDNTCKYVIEYTGDRCVWLMVDSEVVFVLTDEDGDVSKHNAAIVNDGLILHEHFFKKMN